LENNKIQYKMKEIRNYNNKHNYHGYQEWYYGFSNLLTLRGNYKNDSRIGYVERHNWKITIYYIT